MRPLENAEEIISTAARVLGEKLEADRVFYAEVEANDEYLVIPRDYYTSGQSASIAGRFRIDNYSRFVFEELRANRPVVAADAQNIGQDTLLERAGYAALEISAFIAHPLVKGGRLTAILGVTQAVPRNWSKAELEYVAETAERTWTAVERAHAEQALRVLSGQLESLVLERTRALQEANNQLAVSNQELEQFAFVTSHDLQEPLRKIQIYSELLRSRIPAASDSAVAGFADKIIASSDRMRRLIEDLLRFSRISNTPGDFRPVDLNACLQRVLETYDLRIAEKKAILEIAALPQVHGIDWQLELLFANLVGNSLKFSRLGLPPHIAIGSRPLTASEIRHHGLHPGLRYVEISVQDNGIGFDQEHADKIFAIFQRLHGLSEYQGTGIGLAICNKVVTNHRGRIFATSVPGEGATFYVVLPAV